MAVTVETLEKLERRITLTIPANDINAEVESRLKKLARTVKADGFRPGKVPMSVVTQRYGYSVHYEVMNDKVGRAFSDAASEAKLRVAGAPRIEQKDGAPEGQIAFDATFEVYPAFIRNRIPYGFMCAADEVAPPDEPDKARRCREIADRIALLRYACARLECWGSGQPVPPAMMLPTTMTGTPTRWRRSTPIR